MYATQRSHVNAMDLKHERDGFPTPSTTLCQIIKFNVLIVPILF